MNSWKDYKPISYLTEILTHVILSIIAYGLVYIIRSMLISRINSAIIGFILTGVVALIIPNAIFILLYRRDERFAGIIGSIKRKINGRRKEE